MVGAHPIQLGQIESDLHSPKVGSETQRATIRQNLITRFKKSVAELDPTTVQSTLNTIWEGRCQITRSWLTNLISGKILVQPTEKESKITLWVEHQELTDPTWNTELERLVNETFEQIHSHNGLNQKELVDIVLRQEGKILRHSASTHEA